MSGPCALRLRQRAARFARELWVYLLLAVLLTTIIAAVRQLSAPTLLSSLFVGNLALALTIGASCELCAALLLEREGAPPSPRRFWLSLPLLALVALAGAELGLAAIGALLPRDVTLFPHRAVLLISVPTTLVMAGIALLRDRSLHERAQREQVERMLEVARLRALSARTDPHFLFNGLNGIAALIPEDPERAERAVLQLAALFRYVLEGASASFVPLADELAFVRAYLGLEQLRHGERLALRIDVAPSLESARVPPLLLQPLVENAVHHGLSTGPKELTVVVTAHEGEGEAIVLTVDDDGPGPGRSRHQGAGTSHDTMRARIALAYGPGASLETGRSPAGGFRAKLTLPRSGREDPDRRR